MARFEVPDRWQVQAYRFALDPTPVQVSAMESHCGGARFAFNHMLSHVKSVMDQRSAERSYGLDGDELTPPVGWSRTPACGGRSGASTWPSRPSWQNGNLLQFRS